MLMPPMVTAPVNAVPKRTGPRTIMNAAPKDAAEERPRVKGLTRGFRRRPCMTARLTPAKIARRIRGRRKFVMMNAAFSVAGGSMIPGSRVWPRAARTSPGGIAMVPMPAAMTATVMRRRPRAMKMRSLRF